MENKWTIIAALIATVLALSSIPSTFAQAPVGNRVSAQLIYGYSYFTFEDSIENDSLLWDHGIIINLINRPDGGPPVQNPRVELRTDLKLVRFVPDDPLVFTAQPLLGLYIWNFSGVEVEEPAMLPLGASLEDLFIARPRFTVSRIVEPETLSDNITLQTVTVFFRIEESLPSDINWLMISIGNPVIAYQEYRLVEGYFVSQNSLEGWSEGTDGVQAWWSTINPSNLEVGTTYIFQATLELIKSPDLLGSPIFKPEVMVLYGRWLNWPDIITDNSVTITHPTKNISATFIADNVVDWDMALADPFFNFHLWSVVSQITPPPPPFHVIIYADIRIKPET
jgi:hypothetical protein